jgi:hypothetical protein
MNAGALVYCLLDADGEYTPEGYRLLDTAQVGDYELRLWQGTGHRKGEPVKFNEVSLNAKGRSFDPESQAKKYPGSTSAMGHRFELLHTVVNWIKKFGDLYIGSYQPGKLAVYHRMFKRYLSRLQVSDPYPAFDECEGKPEYFHVTAPGHMLESILAEAEVDGDPRRYLDRLPSIVDRAAAEATKLFSEKVQSGDVNDDNFGEMAEAVVNEVVNNLQLSTGDELVDIDQFNKLLQHVLVYADRQWPSTETD